MLEAIAEQLHTALERTPDALCSILIDCDGLVIAKAGDAAKLDTWPGIVTTWMQPLRDLTCEQSDAHATSKVVVTQGAVTTLVVPIGKGAFWAMAIGAQGIVGQTQFLMDCIAPHLCQTVLYSAPTTVDLFKTL